MKNLLSFSLLLSFILFNLTVQAQTDYTWDGSTDTDFATADNWTPSGVPGSGDNITIVTGSNTCQLDGNRTVNKVTVTSGTLDLETYTLTVSDRSTLNGGTMEDGKLLMTTGTADFNGTTMDCKVDVTANITKVYDTHFKDSVLLDEVSTGNGYYTHGNIFEKYTEITNNSTGYIYVANTAPDTFRVNAVFNLEAAGFFIIGQGATTVHFVDDVVLNNHSGNTGRGFSIGGNASSVVDFLGDIEMNVTTGSGYIAFNLGTITHHGQLTVGSEGYHSGTLTLKGYRQNAAMAVDLSPLEDDARITLGPDLELEGDLTCPALYTKLESGCEFNGDVTIPDMRLWYDGSVFNGVTDITVTVGNVYSGGNMFNDTTNLTNEGTGYFGVGGGEADTFNMPVTFNLEAAGYLIVGNGAHANYYADKVTLNNHSGNSSRYIRMGGNVSTDNVFDGEIEMNVDSVSGDISFWLGTTHNGLLTIGSEGYNNGTLTLRNYEQTASGTIDLSTMDSDVDIDVLTGADITADFLFGGGGTATLTDAVFQGDVTIESSSLPVTDCTFHGTTYLEKTGGVNNLNDGNAFHGPVTIENSSTSNYLYWGNAVADTFKMDLTLINRSSQPLWINYSSEGELGGDLTLDGDSASVIRIGSSTAGRNVVFNGSTDQHISILEADLDVQVYRMEVDKSGGRLKVNNDITATHEFTLTDGIVECENDAVITLNDGVEPTAKDTSYVEGKVKKIGNDAFDFPVGSNGHYRPISISAPSSTTDAFSAQHINEDSDPTYEHDDRESSINRIGTNEYWTVERDAGTSDVTVTLSWDELSCGFDTLANLVVTAWEDTIWYDLGNGGTTGDTDDGTVQTSAASGYYGAYALATVDTFDCVPCTAYAGEDTTLLLLQRYTLGGDSVPGNLYAWIPSTYLKYDTVYNPMLQFPDSLSQDGTYIYQLEVENTQGCVATDEVQIALKSKYPPAIDPSNYSSLDPDYYEVVEYMDTYLDEIGADTLEDGLTARYRRWKDFWKNRLPVVQGTKDGRIAKSIDTYLKTFELGVRVCDEGENNEELPFWEPLGPMDMDIANQGLVPSLYVDPNNHNIVFAGSRGGGLFKTTDALTQSGNPTWTCITDMKKLATVGYQSFDVGPYNGTDNLNIVASTWTGMDGWTNNYNIGVAVTIDGGDTWSFSDFPQIEGVESSVYSKKNYQRIVKIVKHPTQAGVFYAISPWRLYRSDDYGLTFENICFNTSEYSENWIDYRFQDLAVDSRTDATNVNKVYLSGIIPMDNPPAEFDEKVGQPQIFSLTVTDQSIVDASSLTNHGEQLEETNQINFILIDHSGGNLSVMYLKDDYWCEPTNNETARTIYIESSDDEGLNFELLISEQTAYSASSSNSCVWTKPKCMPSVFEVSPNLNTIYVESSGRVLARFRTDGMGGYTFSECNWEYDPDNNNDTHADIRDLRIMSFGSGGNNDELFVAHDGGISYSDDSPTYSWTEINGFGLNNSDFFNVSTESDSKLRSYYGAQDNGILNSDEEGLFHVVNNNYDGYEYRRFDDDLNKVVRYSNTGITWDPNVCQPQSFKGRRPRFAQDDFGNIYLAGSEIARYDFAQGASSCEPVGSIQGGTLSAVHATSDDDILYASTGGPGWSHYEDLLLICENATAMNPTWSDISFSQLQYNKIWDIVSSHSNPDHVWVSFSGVGEADTWRVARSTNGGVSWVDYSDGLPGLPVSRLVYQKGSNDLLYAATDIGVYYRDASMTAATGGWKCFSNDLPHAVVSDVEIDMCERKLYAATFGRGAWIVDLIEDNTSTELEISADETWDEDTRIWQSLVTVKSGYTLTIDGTGITGGIDIKMPKGGKIVVEDGARLIVEDATLTNACGYMWQGIEVWGDPNSPRDVTFPSDQGILELENGAIIENAHLGVYLGKDGQGNCCSHSGGIIKSTGGSTASDRVVFRNNRKHVAFMVYDHPSGSYFTRTDFICDAPLQDEDAYPDMGTQQFVSIWAQDGISFTDCKFENSLTGQTSEFGELHRGQGIRAVDAQVYVYSSAHSGSTYYTQFNGLTSGIHSTRTINAAKLYLDDALFDNTLMGVLSEGSIFDKIHSNKFSVPQPDDLSITGYGVYMFDEINHSIDSCLFGSYDTQNEGLRGYVCHGTDDPMFNSGGLAWKNVFDGLLVGTQTERYNRTLQLRCNYYDTDNTVDWWLNPESSWGILGPQGIGCDEALEYRAENRFNDATSGVEHIATNIQAFEYYGSGASGTVPNSNTQEQVDDTENCGIGNDESCDEDPIILEPGYSDSQTALLLIAQQDSTLDVLQAEMDTLKVYLDSSMTDTLLVHIADTNYNNQTLTDELIQYSFLSDTVMNATCSRMPFFTAPQFQDIVVANSPVNEKVWPFLSDALDGFDDKDSAYRDTILSAQGTDSLRTSGAIERDMAVAHTQRFGGIATMLNYYTAYDTVPDSTYALIHFLADSLPDKQWNRVAVGVALRVDTTSWARSILDSIPKETLDDTTFYDYYDLAIDLKGDTLTWFDVDSTQRAMIDTIAAGTSTVKYRAQAVQMLLDDTVFVRIPEQIPQSPSGKRGHEEPAPEELDSQTALKVYPNPFQNQFNVAWELEGDAAQLQFDVFDLTGRLVHTELTQATKFGTHVLNLGECNGFYILRVSENGKQLYQEKLLCLGQ